MSYNIKIQFISLGLFKITKWLQQVWACTLRIAQPCPVSHQKVPQPRDMNHKLLYILW
jgi:hypothetical protein